MEEFYEQIQEILNTHDFIEVDDWEALCQIMFIKYQHAMAWKEHYKKQRDKS
jgi:hypothetical protein